MPRKVLKHVLAVSLKAVTEIIYSVCVGMCVCVCEEISNVTQQDAVLERTQSKRQWFALCCCYDPRASDKILKPFSMDWQQ